MKIHGNLGYSTVFPLQHRHRAMMVCQVADGTAEIQNRIIAKDIYDRRTVVLRATPKLLRDSPKGRPVLRINL